MNTSTVGVITIHKSPSYGASLQAYALWKYISDQGYQTKIIDLLRPYNKEYVHSENYLIYKYLFPKRRNYTDIKIIKHKISRLFKQQITSDINDKLLSERRFDEFNSLVSYSKTYKGPDELYDNPPQYDIYISGSDQVWNPAQPYSVEPYFLTFVQKGKKIAYASSIGLASIPNELKEKFANWWDGYDTLLVRENKAKEIIQKLTCKNVDVVLDPTFLLNVDTWHNFAVKPQMEEYVMLFSLGNDSQLISYGKKLAKKNNLKLIILGHNLANIYADPVIVTAMDAGPCEFLGWIKHAKFVLTDSFHCSVFSILFGTNFYAYIDKNNKRGSRITDLLGMFSLSEHLLRALPIKIEFPQELDKETLLGVIQEQRERSQRLLNEALTK